MDSVGQATWPHTLESVCRGGVVVTMGITTGNDPSANLMRLFVEQITVSGTIMAAVSNISLVSVGALIGTGGLGVLFTDGFQREYFSPIVVGIAATMLLALVVDLLLVYLRNLLTPWERATSGQITAKVAAA